MATIIVIAAVAAVLVVVVWAFRARRRRDSVSVEVRLDKISDVEVSSYKAEHRVVRDVLRKALIAEPGDRTESAAPPASARPSASPPRPRESAPPPASARPSASPPTPAAPPQFDRVRSAAEIREGSMGPDTARSAWRDPDSLRADLEPVHLGASAPQSVRPGDHFSARFVAYVKAFEKEIDTTLAKLSPRSERHLDIKQCRWQIGTPIKVRLYGNHLVVPQPEDSFTWEGQKNMLDFDVEIPQDAPQLVTVLKFDVLIDDIVIARLRLDLEIGSQTREERRTVKGEPARSAFASYASKDRQRVLDRVAEIRRNGVDVFLDCLSLHPGEQWKPRLKQEIVSRELFMLFWSISAKQSEWVTWEWQTALQHRGLEGIDPHPLDPVDVASPPQELSDLHFGDPQMLIRAAYERPTSKT